MQKHEHITDEMLTRYLCGASSGIERQQVEAYLSESDERIDDLLNVVESAEHYGVRPGVRRVRPLWPALSAAACAALLIGISVSLWHRNTGDAARMDAAPAYAAMDTLNTEDSL